MNIDEEVYIELKREYDNQEMLWNSDRKHRMKNLMGETKKLIETWYPDGNQPESVSDIIDNYFSGVFNAERRLELRMGYMYFCREVDKFLANPNSMWEFYEQNKDKIDFREAPFIRYTTNEKQNEKMFLNDMINFFLGDMDIPPAFLDKADEETKKTVLDMIVKQYKKEAKAAFAGECKEKLVLKLEETIEKLEDLGAIEVNRKQHNDKMNRLGLTPLCIDENLACLDGDDLFGFDLKNCSILQLEAMLCFYSNRIEKVRENVGLGLFIFQEQEKRGKSITDPISDEELKEYLKKYNILSNITNDVFDVIYKLEVDSNWELSGQDFEKAYERLFDKYAGGFTKLFYNTEGKVLSEEEEKNNYKKYFDEVASFTMGNTSFRMNNYLIKSRLMEDIILQAIDQNLNWGIMEEEGEINIRKRVLIGIDIPGMNMPLRVHCDVNALKDLMHNYLKTDEVPIYVGADDFDTRGREEGTQFLLPLKTNECNFIKSISKKKDSLSSSAHKFVKHIACMQMPNPLKRILTEKTGKSQKYPDVVDIYTKKVKRVPRENGREEK